MKKAVTQSVRFDRNMTNAEGAKAFETTTKEEAAILREAEVIYMGVVAVVYKDAAVIIKVVGGLPEMSGVPEVREEAVKEFTKALRKAMVQAQDELIAEEAMKYVKAGARKPKTPTTTPEEEDVAYEPSF